jgi:hypothetical protein
VAPVSSAIRSSTGLGNTSDPKTARTSCSFTWSMSRATSLGVGSSKLETWMAPTTVQS